MKRIAPAAWALVLACTIGTIAARAADAPDAATAEKKANDWLTTNVPGGAAPKAEATDQAPLRGVFPQQVFFLVTIRQFPMARMAPAPLKNQNVLAVSADAVVHLPDAAALESFFKKSLAPAKTDDDIKKAAAAWAALTSEFSQDGFYRFVPGDPTVAPDGTNKSATVVITPKADNGDKGTITSKLTFDADGKLVAVAEERKLQPGVRPICQATKLLDADPVVRRMAERDILVMGEGCKPYLDEQRALASPELQAAIDAIWQRVLRGER